MAMRIMQQYKQEKKYQAKARLENYVQPEGYHADIENVGLVNSFDTGTVSDRKKRTKRERKKKKNHKMVALLNTNKQWKKQTS